MQAKVEVFGTLLHSRHGELDVILTAYVEPDSPQTRWEPATLGEVDFEETATVDGGCADGKTIDLADCSSFEASIGYLEEQARCSASELIEDEYYLGQPIP